MFTLYKRNIHPLRKAAAWGLDGSERNVSEKYFPEMLWRSEENERL